MASEMTETHPIRIPTVIFITIRTVLEATERAAALFFLFWAFSGTSPQSPARIWGEFVLQRRV
jgi:hypothetical protein